MSEADMASQSLANTVSKIKALTALGAGGLIDNTLNKLIKYQLTRYRNSIAQLTQDLKYYEDKYNMSSETFYQDFENGKLGDEENYFEWSCLYENKRLYEKRIKQMESIDT